MKYAAVYYDAGNCYIDTKEFIVNSKEELEEKSREYAKALDEEGYEIAGWNYHRRKEDC